MSFRSEFADGTSAIAPLLPAAATVAATAGVAAPVAGLSPVQAVAMSVAVYFPSVMLTALELLRSHLPFAVVVVTSLVVGVRVVLLSLSIAPYFERFSTRWKWVLAYFLWTPVYALTVDRFASEPTADVRGFYLGMAVPLWVTAQCSFVVGVAFSASVPPGLHLDFVVTLAFISLLTDFLTGEATEVAALVAGVLAVLGAGAPLGLGVVAATLAGVLAGAVVAARRGRR